MFWKIQLERVNPFRVCKVDQIRIKNVFFYVFIYVEYNGKEQI